MARLKQTRRIYSDSERLIYLQITGLVSVPLVLLLDSKIVKTYAEITVQTVEFLFKYNTSTTNILIIRSTTAHNPKLNLFNNENSKIRGNG